MKRKIKKRIRKSYQYSGVLIIALLSIYIFGYLFVPDDMDKLTDNLGINKNQLLYSKKDIDLPKDEGKKYIILNDNIPEFTDAELSVTSSYESYSDLDDLGRAGVAIANIGKDIMPTEKRGEIGSVKPTGWHTIKYEGIDGNYLYNRCHLIGFQLTGENANVKNLITCTRETNNDVMTDFENKVANYIKKTNNHVLYRVTPYFIDNNLLATGIKMEAYSIEDNGKGIMFNIFIYNKQTGIEINYNNGDSRLAQ